MRAHIFGGLGNWLARLVSGWKVTNRESAAVRARRRKRLTELLMVGARATGKQGRWLLQRASAVLRTLEDEWKTTCQTELDHQRGSLGRAYHDQADRFLTQAVLGGGAVTQKAALRNLWTAASYLK